MTNLVIDIGNSTAKAGLFRDRELLKTAVLADADPAAIREFLSGEAFDRSIISSVRTGISALEPFLESQSDLIRFHSGLHPGIRSRYKTPETLGPDRLAAVIGAATIYPAADTLVIDAGTCITFDFVDRDGTYFGGSISPGLAMRFRALHDYTGKLPHLPADPVFGGHFGEDTRTAILSGVQNGLWYEVSGHISSFRADYPALRVVLCGGDAPFFESRLKISIFAPIVKIEPTLVLSGLNEVIFHYNE